MVGDCERQEAGGGQACGDGMTWVAWGAKGPRWDMLVAGRF